MLKLATEILPRTMTKEKMAPGASACTRLQKYLSPTIIRLKGGHKRPTKSGPPEDLQAQRVTFIIPSTKCLIMPETSS